MFIYYYWIARVVVLDNIGRVWHSLFEISLTRVARVSVLRFMPGQQWAPNHAVQLRPVVESLQAEYIASQGGQPTAGTLHPHNHLSESRSRASG